MLGQILSSIATPSLDNSLISNLQHQNAQIDSQLQAIEQSLNQLPFQQLISHLQSQSGFNSSLLSKGERMEQILSIVQAFHQAHHRSQKQNRRLSYLLDEIQIILNEVDSLQILAILQEPIAMPSHQYLANIKQIMSHINDQIVEYQNFQNAADFHSQEQGESQRVEYVIKFYLYIKEIYEGTLDKSIKRSYSNAEEQFNIEMQYIMAIWQEKQQYYNEFLNKLNNFFERFIRYNINDRQYILINYTIIDHPNSVSFIAKTEIIFDSNETSLHFEALKRSLQVLKESIERIEAIVPQHRQASVLSLKKSILQTIKSHVEYLLPYLKMEQRRELLSELTISHSSFTVDIYQLLVSLRMCGKDADMLVRTIKQLAARVHEQPSSLAVVLKYVQLAKENKNNLQLNFFLCDQLIHQFEEGEVSEPIKNAIKILLLTREEQRMKIHSADN